MFVCPQGVPIRVELGPRDVEGRKFVSVCRDTGEKKEGSMDGAVDIVKEELADIQRRMLKKWGWSSWWEWLGFCVTDFAIYGIWKSTGHVGFSWCINMRAFGITTIK